MKTHQTRDRTHKFDRLPQWSIQGPIHLLRFWVKNQQSPGGPPNSPKTTKTLKTFFHLHKNAPCVKSTILWTIVGKGGEKERKCLG